MLHIHERYDLIYIYFFYKTSSRKSIVSNIHYRVTATANSSLCCNSWQPSQCFSLHLQVAGVTSTCYVLQENIHNAATSQSQPCQDLQSEIYKSIFLKTDLGRNIFLWNIIYERIYYAQDLSLKKNAFINLRLQVLTRLSLSTVAAALCPNYCKRVGGACPTTHQYSLCWHTSSRMNRILHLFAIPIHVIIYKKH